MHQLLGWISSEANPIPLYHSKPQTKFWGSKLLGSAPSEHLFYTKDFRKNKGKLNFLRLFNFLFLKIIDCWGTITSLHTSINPYLCLSYIKHQGCHVNNLSHKSYNQYFRKEKYSTDQENDQDLLPLPYLLPDLRLEEGQVK